MEHLSPESSHGHSEVQNIDPNRLIPTGDERQSWKAGRGEVVVTGGKESLGQFSRQLSSAFPYGPNHGQNLRSQVSF